MDIKTKIEQIRRKGYEFLKGYLMPNGEIYQYEGDYDFIIVTPNGERKDVCGLLDNIFYVSEDKIPTTRREIITELYHPTAEQWCEYEFGYSLRTKKYLDAVSERIGLLEMDCSDSADIIKNDTTIKVNYSIWYTSFMSKVDEKYVVQHIRRVEIDTWLIYTFVFDKRPNDKIIRTSFNLYDVQRNMNNRFPDKYRETYRCYECNRETHWLDVEGDFNRKYECLTEKYCGC